MYQNATEIHVHNVDAAVSALETTVKFVPIDGDASKEQIEKIIHLLPKDLQKLPLEEIIHIGGLIDAQKLASDFFLDYNFKPNPIPKAAVNWAYGLKDIKEFDDSEVKICPKTFRPLSTYGNKSWEEYVENKFHIPVDKMMKARKYFG